jgi:uncharacterized protein YciI
MSRKFVAASALVVLAVFTAFAPVARQAAAKAPGTWLVTFDLGAKFDATKPLQQQAGFMDHLAAIKKLDTDGKMLVGGPLLETFESHKITGAIWLLSAEDAEAAKKLAATDPFVSGEQLKIASVRAFYPGSGAWVPAANKPGPAGH